ncbi:chemotaxis protein CheV [Zooshikella marina]|uniref:Chemotaxis protein CheV n=1 Tax=Zooshikella ganghwensis TaxID=202772 RepID=A0A4P9VJH3_9GAMM|nr:chemotaxis protein [Zooshikella ganghwensis]MBU2706504.1 chemotaxis protein CheV [Zooshikella ganghwensis]RDH42310.1 chemotaxis protein CheV [Zooshikella ganghwensis]
MTGISQSNSSDQRHLGQDLLLFRLCGKQRYGINVLKIKEIIPTQKLTQLPQAHPAIVGIAKLRGTPLSVIDLAQAIGLTPLRDTQGKINIIIAEFNRTMQGFLVGEVERIVSLSWKDILPPPKATGKGSYVTGVTSFDKDMIEIIDVEKVLNEVVPEHIGSSLLKLQLLPEQIAILKDKLIMVVDDSSMARKQICQTLDKLPVKYVVSNDGKEALDLLRNLHQQGRHVDMIISDIEMPEMDGYTLTREIRKDQDLSSMYILLHTSLSSSITSAAADASGADAALTKFVSEELSSIVLKALEAS